MALRTVNLSDPFIQWKDDHNNLAQDVGDISLLGTAVNTNIVLAINSLDSDVRALVANGKVTIYDQNGTALN